MQFVGGCQVSEAPFGFIADARVGGTPVRSLVDTGATINLIRSDVYIRLTAAPALRTYKGSLETADGCAVNVDGWITTNLELGSINDDIEALVVPELKAEVILGMQSLMEYECSLDFHCNNLWTGPKEGSIFPFHYKPLRATSPGPSAVTDSQNPAAYVTETLPQQPTYGPGDLVEGRTHDEEDHFVQVISNGDEVDLQAQAERHLEEDVQKILELAAPGVAGAERDRLRELIRSHRDMFALTDAELGQTNLVTHRIDTGPIKIPPHRASPAKMPIIQEEVQSMVDKGVIQPSKIPYSAPIVLQKKKDGSWRFCVDYRKLNDVTINDAFPIPRIQQTFDALK